MEKLSGKLQRMASVFCRSFFDRRVLLIVTNNKLVDSEFENVKYLENYKYLEVLMYCRDEIHKGYKLLTHPLSGSVKPNETPFKSVVLSDEKGSLDFESLDIIENAITTTKKFLNNSEIRDWPERILYDFQIIDLGLIKGALNK